MLDVVFGKLKFRDRLSQLLETVHSNNKTWKYSELKPRWLYRKAALRASETAAVLIIGFLDRWI